MTNTQKAFAVVGLVAVAGLATLEATRDKVARAVEGRYLRVRECHARGAKPATSLRAIATETWAKDAKPAQTDCEWLTVLAQTTADGGVGSSVIVSREPALDMGAKMEVYGKGDALGFEAACSTGKECEVLRTYLPEMKREPEWVPAPIGVTLAKGRWRGAGCFRKPAVELAKRGVTSWPSECPTE
jgi:hypothetical protein